MKSPTPPSTGQRGLPPCTKQDEAAAEAVGHAVGRRPDSDLTPAQIIVRDCHRDIYGYRHARPPPPARPTSSTATSRKTARGADQGAVVETGSTPTACAGGAAGPAAGASARRRGRSSRAGRLPVADWTGFCSGDVLRRHGGHARSDRRSETTPPYWLAKAFPLVLEGVRTAPSSPGACRSTRCSTRSPSRTSRGCRTDPGCPAATPGRTSASGSAATPSACRSSAPRARARRAAPGRWRRSAAA